MSLSFGNEVDYFKEHLTEILKNVTNECDSPISFSPTFLEQLLPAFFVSSQQDVAIGIDNLTEFTALRTEGYLTFYRSLSNYIVKQYNTLSAAFLERILAQAYSMLPMTKIASCLQLDNGRYTTQHDSCDRLTILLGILLSHFGTYTVDSFLYPLFTTHVFNEKHPQQIDQSQCFAAFRNLIQKRGGSFEPCYERIQQSPSQTQLQWSCTITYQLARNTPFVMHQRNGQSKKQAKLRAQQDILNYYTRNDASLVLHCSTISDKSPHPHSQQLMDHEPEHVVQKLSIPVELMYQYDDTDDQQQLQSPVSVKRHHDSMAEDSSSHMECNDNNMDGSNNQTSFLTQALLYDFSNLSCDDSHQSSPSSLGSPASIITLKQQSPNDSSLTTPTTMSSPSSTNALSINVEPMNVECIDQPMMNKKQRTCTEGIFTRQQQLADGMVLDQSTDTPLQQLSSDELTATAIQMLTISGKLRQRVQRLGEQLTQIPGNAKGVLKGLDGGTYSCDMKHIQPEKSSPINNGMGYFTATVSFTMAGLTLILTRQHPKKKDAETIAAFAIFSLLLTSTTATTATTATTTTATTATTTTTTFPLPPSETSLQP